MKMCAASGCSRPVFGKGYCKVHQYMRADFDRRSSAQKYLDKVKAGEAVKAVVDDEVRFDIVGKSVDGGAELQRWFEDRRKEMGGYCLNCGGKSCKDDDKYFKYSICHILPKAYFPSVATHPSNWIELCFWNRSCHTNMDNKTLDLIEMNCWDLIVRRFQEMYPSIAPKERKRIPSVLLEYVGTDL